jgi:hypothetical protein
LLMERRNRPPTKGEATPPPSDSSRDQDHYRGRRETGEQGVTL